jgi:hypothetical protein
LPLSCRQICAAAKPPNLNTQARCLCH